LSFAGVTSAIATMQAYMSDTTDQAARYVFYFLSSATPAIIPSSSRTFSLFLGIAFTGVALGPILGAILTHSTHDVLSVFYASTIINLGCTFFSWLIIPESVSRPKMIAFRIQHQEEQENLKGAREGVTVGILAIIKRAFGFLSPLALFMPVSITGHSPSKSRGTWNLTLLAAGYGMTVMISVGTPKFIARRAMSGLSMIRE
jgi:MFS family permease